MFVSHQHSAINTADRSVDYDLCGDFGSKQVSSWPSTNLWLNFFLSSDVSLEVCLLFLQNTHHNFFTICFRVYFTFLCVFYWTCRCSSTFFLLSFLISFRGKQNTFPFTLRACILAHELTTSPKVFIKWIFLMTFNVKREAGSEKITHKKEDEWKPHQYKTRIAKLRLASKHQMVRFMVIDKNSLNARVSWFLIEISYSRKVIRTIVICLGWMKIHISFSIQRLFPSCLI